MTRDRGLYRVQSLLTSQGYSRYSYTFSRLFIQDIFRVGHPAEAQYSGRNGAITQQGSSPPKKLSHDYLKFKCIKFNIRRMCSVEQMLWQMLDRWQNPVQRLCQAASLVYISLCSVFLYPTFQPRQKCPFFSHLFTTECTLLKHIL